MFSELFFLFAGRTLDVVGLGVYSWGVGDGGQGDRVGGLGGLIRGFWSICGEG